MNAPLVRPGLWERGRFGLARLFRIREVGLISIVVIVSIVAAISIPAFRNGVNLRELLNNAAVVAIVARCSVAVVVASNHRVPAVGSWSRTSRNNRPTRASSALDQ